MPADTCFGPRRRRYRGAKDVHLRHVGHEEISPVDSLCAIGATPKGIKCLLRLLREDRLDLLSEKVIGSGKSSRMKACAIVAPLWNATLNGVCHGIPEI